MLPAPRPALVLGTAQLGLPYGAANVTGFPSDTEAIDLVRAAIEGGIRVIDTARAYGIAEHRIGRALRDHPEIEIVTKLDPMVEIPADASQNVARRAAAGSVEASRRALGRDRLDVLLLHRAAHRAAWNGAVWSFLQEEEARGRIGRLGVSAQSPEELLAALEDPGVRHVQFPFNMLDFRWREAGCVDRLRARHDVTVHVRSVFLQGLLAAPDRAKWPRVEGLVAAAVALTLADLVRESGRSVCAALALDFVAEENWIDGIVLGMETRAQLDANLAFWCGASITPATRAKILDLQRRIPPALLDPSTW
ncbi:MAG: aldo/keto reductase [Bacteroidales bacterium]|nr:aldo/keto reductase [Bacteroidales bacterium]